MTEHRQQNHNGAGFEREDLGGRPVYGFMISLVVIGVLIYYMLWGMFRFLDVYERKHQPAARSPLVQYEHDTREANTQKTYEKVNREFPEPRLEDNERTEINDIRYREEETLNSYGWVDQSQGVARIPIDRAMQLLAERGLPTNPKAGTTPPSTVNMVKQAAAKADASNRQKSAGQTQPGKGKPQ